MLINKKTFSLILLLCFFISIFFMIFYSIEKNKHNKTYEVTIEDQNDLIKLLGFDFGNANIDSMMVSSSNNCVCVILNEDYTDFSKDSFIQSAFTKDNGGFFKRLKATFPKIFSMDFSSLKNIQMSAKTFEFESKDSTLGIPYYINWFTTEIENTEQIVIYAFLPDEIQSIKNNWRQEDGSPIS